MTAQNKGRTADQEWTARRERGAIPMIKLFVWISLRLGRSVARLLLYPICLYFLAFSGKSRTASRAYLTRVLGRRPSVVDLFCHYYCFASCVLDRVYLLNGQLGLFDLHVHGEEIVAEILKRGSGCFLLGAHLGSFEVLRALGRRQESLRVSLAMYEDNARKVNSVLNAISPELALDIIGLGRFDAMIRVQQRLKEGHFVGILADRSLECEAQVRLPFLGEAAGFPTGPFRMITILRAPVVLMFGVYRGGNRYDVFFERLIEPVTPRARDGAELVTSAMQDYVGRLEHYCRLAPYNWFNFYDFWK